ncbi:hypothetical protein MDPP_001561 [Candidatus Phytoplasma pini]|uniref:Diadenylate cyclase n=1 Tax=Candidatus Phytoplasma pini TaxID=267362 RepID=A0A559KJ61_9MOLU|nr:hypothetical protein MDPP_001561 [Candidatus Phytoplasma pini]
MTIVKLFFYFLFLFIFIYISLCILFSKYEFIKIIYSLILAVLFIYFVTKFSNYLGLKNGMSLTDIVLISLCTFTFLFPIIIKAPHLRFYLQIFAKNWHQKKTFYIVNEQTKQHILEAVLFLSKKKIGALITIEKNNTLEQFAQKSILIEGNVSKELLINIFFPNSLLHDGAVIIRGNKILSAGAYFMLSEKEKFEKTTGSRHRAALGISENTDSMTIVVSEEKGSISIALNGIMLKMKDHNQIKEYLNMFIV